MINNIKKISGIILAVVMLVLAYKKQFLVTTQAKVIAVLFFICICAEILKRKY